MGMRFSKYNRYKTLAGINDMVDQRNYNYIDALKIAILDDSIAFFQKLNDRAVFMYKDLAPNEELDRKKKKKR